MNRFHQFTILPTLFQRRHGVVEFDFCLVLLLHHFLTLKTFQKAILYFLGTALIIAIALIASVFIFKDRIIEEFIKEANKSLSTPIKIGKIEISAWNDFPNLAIVFEDVYVEDSYPGEHALLTATTISFYLNPVEAWNGKYSIRGLQVTNSETDLKINTVGKSNFTIVKESEDAGGSISFDRDGSWRPRRSARAGTEWLRDRKSVV